MSHPVAAPAGFVPQMAISFAAAGAATAVDVDHPLPTGERAFQGAIALVPDVDQTAQRGVAIRCTSAGTVQFKLADGSLLAVPVDTGFAILPLAVRMLVSAGTTAAVTCSSLV